MKDSDSLMSLQQRDTQPRTRIGKGRAPAEKECAQSKLGLFVLSSGTMMWLSRILLLH